MPIKMTEAHVFHEKPAQFSGEEILLRKHAINKVPVPLRRSLKIESYSLSDEYENILQTVIK